MSHKPADSFGPIFSLWGGRGARQILRLRFPRTLIDDRTFDMVYTDEGVNRVWAMGFRWVCFMASWGFAPEIEAVDWDIFRRAVKLYHDAGVRVIGGIQVSNYVAQGSYSDKTWQALDPWGHPILFGAGRYYTCWHDPAWIEEVEKRIRLVSESGVDGFLFASPWMGGVPIAAGHGLIGAAGCHNELCQKAYAEASGGAKIPALLNLRNDQVQHYLRWRADVTSQRLQQWSELARQSKAELPVFIESAAQFNPFVQYGHDAKQLSGMLVIPGELPRVETDVIQNATSTGMIGAKRKQTASMVGPTWEERAGGDLNFARALAEASALHTQPMISGMGMKQQRSLTLLIRSPFEREQQQISQMNTWLTKNANWLEDRQANISPLAVYNPYPAVWGKWGQIAPFFWGACETIIRHGLPFRIVGEGDWNDVNTLIVPPGEVEGLDRRLAEFVERGGRVLPLQWARTGGRPLWISYRPAQPLRRYHWPLVRRITYRAATTIQRWRYKYPLNRVVMDEMSRLAVPDELQTELVEAIGTTFGPRAAGENPLLFTLWRESSGGEQWHLVNYESKPQRVTLHTPQFVSGWVFTALEDHPVKIFGNGLMMTVHDYKVLRISNKTPG